MTPVDGTVEIPGGSLEIDPKGKVKSKKPKIKMPSLKRGKYCRLNDSISMELSLNDVISCYFSYQKLRLETWTALRLASTASVSQCLMTQVLILPTTTYYYLVLSSTI